MDPDQVRGIQGHMHGSMLLCTLFGSPYLPLYESVMEFSSLNDIILIGDINARTDHINAPFFEAASPMYKEIDIEGISDWTPQTWEA